MLYADSDFFVALLKKKDWLKERAKRLYARYQGEIWTSSATLLELLLISQEFGLDPERLLVDVFQIAHVEGRDRKTYMLAAHYMKNEGVGVFDSAHAASCGKAGKIISSDKVFDRLGLDRIKLGAA